MEIKGFIEQFVGTADEWERVRRANDPQKTSASETSHPPHAKNGDTVFAQIKRALRAVTAQSQQTVIAALFEHDGQMSRDDLLHATGHTHDSLRGALAALTRRVEPILGADKLIETNSAGYQISEKYLSSLGDLVEPLTRRNQLNLKIQEAIAAAGFEIIRPYNRAEDEFQVWFVPQNWRKELPKLVDGKTALCWVERTYYRWEDKGVNWNQLQMVIGVPEGVSATKADQVEKALKGVPTKYFRDVAPLEYDDWRYLQLCTLATEQELSDDGFDALQSKLKSLSREDIPKFTAALNAIFG